MEQISKYSSVSEIITGCLVAEYHISSIDNTLINGNAFKSLQHSRLVIMDTRLNHLITQGISTTLATKPGDKPIAHYNYLSLSSLVDDVKISCSHVMAFQVSRIF